MLSNGNIMYVATVFSAQQLFECIQVVYCCWLAFELTFLYFFVIETKNHTLEETSALFDGQGASQLQYGVGVDILSPSDKSSGSLCEPVDISIVSH